MHCVLITSFYPPEIRSISTMMRELAWGLNSRGHQVTVVTPVPKDNVPDEEKGTVQPAVSYEGHVKVVRIETPGQQTSNYVLRGVAELILPYLYRRAIKKYVVGSIDAVIVYTPHFPLTQVGAWVKSRYHARYILNVQDIFPQNAIDAGIMRNRFLIRLYEFLERRSYQHADQVTTHTIGGRDFLITKKSVSPGKIEVVHNWIDIEAFNVKNTGVFRARYGLEEKFIFLFAGVFGPTQGLDLLLELSSRTQDLSEVCFLMVGEGTDKQRLQGEVSARNLSNVHFQPFVPPAEYPFLLQEVDVGIMCLASTNTTAVVPGKLTGYMASGLPVLAFLQKESEGHRIIREARCGYSVVSSDIAEAEAGLRKMVAERATLAAQGVRGREYARTHFSREQCIDHITRLLSRV